MSENQKNPGCFSSIVRYIVGALLSVAIIAALSGGMNMIHQNNNTQREAKISLNEYIEQEKTFPENEYVSLKLRWVIGPYAEETSTMGTRYSDDGFTTGVDYYYYAVLEDWTVMTIKAANSAEVSKLDRMSDWLLSVEGYPLDGETITLQGKLKQLTDKELLGFYKDNLDIFGLSASDSEVRYLMLDTTAGRERLYIIITVAVVGVIVAVVLSKNIRQRKEIKKQLAEQEALNAAMEQAAQNQMAVQRMMQSRAENPNQFPDPQ